MKKKKTLKRLEAAGVVLRGMESYEAMPTRELGSWLTYMRGMLNQAERAYVNDNDDEVLWYVTHLGRFVIICLEQHGPGPEYDSEIGIVLGISDDL